MKPAAARSLPVGDTRDRIVAAAEALARDVGPGNLSIDAVAERAGLSKGGMLYHFPSKLKLLQALVERHVERSEALLQRQIETGGDGTLPQGMIAMCRHARASRTPESACGVLAAISENPGLVAPVHAWQKSLVARLLAGGGDPELSLIVFLVLEGLSALHLFDSDCLADAEVEAVLARLERLVAA